MKDCERAAKVSVRLCIPFKDVPREGNYPFKVLMNVPVCVECFPRIAPKQFIRHDLKKYVIRCINKTPAPEGFKLRQPDFDRAWLEQVKMDSTEYQNMIAALNDGQGVDTEFQIGGER